MKIRQIYQQLRRGYFNGRVLYFGKMIRLSSYLWARSNLESFQAKGLIWFLLTAGDGGGYIASRNLIFRSLFPSDQLDGYWIPTPRLYFSQSQSPGAELHQAIENLFIPAKYINPVGSVTQVRCDEYNLSILDSTDALGNRSSIEDRLANGTVNPGGFDYRVLQPRVVSDVNRNRTKFAFDALGALVGQALQGKPEESLGDSLDDFEANLDGRVILQFLQNPSAGRLHSRPCTINRFTHATTTSEVGAALGYFDGFKRLIQNKTQVNPGPVTSRDAQSKIMLDNDDKPILTTSSSDPRWLTFGWVIYDNKGNAVCEYEPYFTDKTEFEFDTLTSYDTTDTVMCDPRTDPDLQGYVDHYFSDALKFATWYESRAAGQVDNLEEQGALKAAFLADAPTIQYFDALGRGFLNSTQVKTVLDGHGLNDTTQPSYTRFDLDIDGNTLAVHDAMDRTIKTFSYDMMEGPSECLRLMVERGGTRWSVNSGSSTTSHFVHCILLITTTSGGAETLVQSQIYGDAHPEAEQRNMKGNRGTISKLETNVGEMKIISVQQLPVDITEDMQAIGNTSIPDSTGTRADVVRSAADLCKALRNLQRNIRKM
ncbi:hypothetical protein BKA61DRAFT_574326 [Leptodontidium sp. MPI-SDFR-AT-0119]|nr:hypothetical protein BKA61DRAFT_574326 [Leptodontidium sp. MPI-SDFR-AT-0119]